MRGRFPNFLGQRLRVHELYDEVVPLADIFACAKKYGKEDQIFYFASTSKVTFSGAGLALFAASDNNLRQIKPYLSAQTSARTKSISCATFGFCGMQKACGKSCGVMPPLFVPSLKR